MEHRDAFSACHPLVNFLYFALVLGFTMFFQHPLLLGASLACALAYAGYLDGEKAARRGLIFLLPMALLAALVNPAFSHRGVTILAYLPSGNPLTLESVACGLGAALLLAASLTWFSCCTAVFTADKFVCLFGRVIPALSLVLSMTLRSVPRFAARFRAAAEGQRCVGRDLSAGGLLRRARQAVAVLSIVVTWSLESAVETADSMRSRGYGLPERTAFSIYPFTGRDRGLLAWLALCGGYIFSGWMAGGLSWRYYPTMGGTEWGIFPASFLLAFLALCLTPVILDRREDARWRRLRSKL